MHYVFNRRFVLAFVCFCVVIALAAILGNFQRFTQTDKDNHQDIETNFIQSSAGGPVSVMPTVPTAAETAPVEPVVPPITEPLPTEPTTPPGTEPKPTEPTVPPATEPKPTEPEHQHSYTEEVTQAATCAAEGVKTFACDCGEQYTEVIGRLPHDFSSVVTAPTCEERGFTTYVCSCGHSFHDDFVNATGHDYGAWVTIQEPSEDADGATQRVCQNCEKTETKVLEKLEHAHRYTSQVTKEASCTEEGVETFSCSCGDSYTKPIAKLSHSYTAEAIGPTCTEKGYTLHTCICGDSYRDSYKDAIGHSYGEWVTTKEPTETETGTARRDCKNCEDFETKTLEKLEHVHRYTSQVTKEPSCTAEGVETFCCPCGASYTVKIAKLDHSYTAKVIKPTCAEKGYTLHICACGDSYNDTYKNATGHSYSSKVTKPATCSEAGVKTYTCKCGDSYTKEIAIKEHSYKKKGIKPTCTEHGYTLYSCTCGDSYQDAFVDAKGHSWRSWTVSEEATTSSCGVMIRSCSSCKTSESMLLEKLIPIDLAQIVPTDLFASMTPEGKIAVEAVLACLDVHYGRILVDTPYISVRVDFYVSEEIRNEIFTYLSLYFGVYYEVNDMLSYLRYVSSKDTYTLIYIDTKLAYTLEANRRSMMASIDEIVSTFAVGNEGYLVEQAYKALAKILVYDRNQPSSVYALESGKGSCNAYSTLFRLVLHRLGIQSDVCFGLTSKGTYHAWNKVNFTDGSCRYYDLVYYESAGKKYVGASSSYHQLISVNVYLTASQLPVS